MTLTYGEGRSGDADHERAAILTYSDFQKYLKLLRRHDYPVRYFVAGEYGSKKGRAHWHAILYWQKRKPEFDLRVNTHDPHWIDTDGTPRGFVFWDDVRPSSALYCCKYVMKGNPDPAKQAMLRMSKQPPLGMLYFRQEAERYVEQGLAPQTLEYTFPGVYWYSRDGSKAPWRFRLKDRPAEMYLQHYVDTWRKVHGDRHLPNSELIEEFLDPGAWKNREAKLSPFDERKLIYPEVNMARRAMQEWTPDDFERQLDVTEELIRLRNEAIARTDAAKKEDKNG